MNGYAGEAQCIVLGAGAAHYEDMLRHLAGFHQGKMTAFIGYDAELAPLIYGGSDVFLMPSLFEPCGLGQMMAMRYGSVPVVRAAGGLADTVRSGVQASRSTTIPPTIFGMPCKKRSTSGATTPKAGAHCNATA